MRTSAEGRGLTTGAAHPVRRAVVAVVGALAVVPATLTGLSALAPSPASAAPAAQDWPTYLHDNARSSATTDPSLSLATVGQLQLDWAAQTGGPIATSASIVGTTAYVGSWDGNEYAINTGTGTVLWKTNLGITTDPGCNPSTIGITSAATVLNGVVYVGGGGPNWYALDATTGAVLWSVYTGDNSQAGAHYNWSSPLIVNGYAYVGIASNCDNPLVQGQLLKVSLASQSIVATYNFVPNGQVGGGIWTSPTYDPATNRIFVSTGTLAGYNQTQSQAIVALDAGHPGLRRLVAAPLRGLRRRLRLEHHPDPDHRRPGRPAALGVQQERGPLHLQPQQPGRRADLAAGHRHRRQLSDLRGRHPALGHLRQQRPVRRGRPHHGREPGLDQRHRPGHRQRAVDPTDRPADPGLPGLCERDDRRGGGVDLRGPERPDRLAGLLLRPARRGVRGHLRRPGSVLCGGRRRQALRLRHRARTGHPPDRRQLPGRLHVPGHPRSGQGERVDGRRYPDGDGRRDRDQGDRRPVPSGGRAGDRQLPGQRDRDRPDPTGWASPSRPG